MHIEATKREVTGTSEEPTAVPCTTCPDCGEEIQSLQFLIWDSGTGICPSCQTSFNWRRVEDKQQTVEMRKEYDQRESIMCPKCGSDLLDYTKDLSHGTCGKCGLGVHIVTTLKWK